MLAPVALLSSLASKAPCCFFWAARTEKAEIPYRQAFGRFEARLGPPARCPLFLTPYSTRQNRKKSGTNLFKPLYWRTQKGSHRKPAKAPISTGNPLERHADFWAVGPCGGNPLLSSYPGLLFQLAHWCGLVV